MVQTLLLALTYSLNSSGSRVQWEVSSVFRLVLHSRADPQLSRGLGLSCWDYGLESSRRHGCLSLVSVVRRQVEVSATDWSLVQRSPTDCGVSELWSWSLDKEEAQPTGCSQAKSYIARSFNEICYPLRSSMYNIGWMRWLSMKTVGSFGNYQNFCLKYGRR